MSSASASSANMRTAAPGTSAARRRSPAAIRKSLKSMRRGIVRPVGDGQATIIIEAGGQKATIPVKVTKAAADMPVSFSREVVPVLTARPAAIRRLPRRPARPRRLPPSCSVSIRCSTIRRSCRAARAAGSSCPIRSAASCCRSRPASWSTAAVNVSRPTAAVTTSSRPGSKTVPRSPARKDPIVTGLEVLPPKRVMTPGEQQQIAVRATWSDGRNEDVTSDRPVRRSQRRRRRHHAGRPHHGEGARRDAHHDPLRRSGHRLAGDDALCSHRRPIPSCRATISSTRSSSPNGRTSA